MKTTLATVNLEVADVPSSTAFYTAVLQMRENAERSHPPGFAFLESSGSAVTLAARAEPAPAGALRSIELGFQTDDLPAFREHLARLGLTDVSPQSMGWGEAVELRDPDGHRVIVYALRET